jgi:hypothetical protein
MLVQVVAYIQAPAVECLLGMGVAHRLVRGVGFPLDQVAGCPWGQMVDFQPVLVVVCPPARGAASLLVQGAVFLQGLVVDFQLTPEVGCILGRHLNLIEATYLHGQYLSKNSKKEVCSILPTSSNPF